MANSIVAQLLFLQSDDPKADIHLYVNSPGGSVTAGGDYDTMQFVCDVATSASARRLRWARAAPAGAPASARSSNARIMIHQPLAGMEGTAEEIMIHPRIQEIKAKLSQILIKHTGHRWTDRARHRSRPL